MRHHVLTLGDYLDAERISPHKHEFADGQIYLMAGGSPRHVVLIEPDAVDVEVWTRGDAGWTRTVAVAREDRVRLEAIGVEIPVAEIYEGLERIPV